VDDLVDGTSLCAPVVGSVAGDLSMRSVPPVSPYLYLALAAGGEQNMESILPTEKRHSYATQSSGDAGNAR
jgi:hypothetical protein